MTLAQIWLLIKCIVVCILTIRFLFGDKDEIRTLYYGIFAIMLAIEVN